MKKSKDSGHSKREELPPDVYHLTPQNQMQWRHKMERKEETNMNCQGKKKNPEREYRRVRERERDVGIREKDRRKGKRES